MTTHKREDAITRKRVAIPTPQPPPKQDPIPHRQIWGGAAALVAAMLLLFFVPRLLHSATKSTASTTIARATATSTAAPTPTPTAQTPTQAWGAAAVVHMPLALPDGTTFVPSDISPDGKMLVGYAISSQTPQAPYDIETVTLPGLGVQKLYKMAADAAPPTVKTDGTYVAWIGGNSYTGGTGQIHQIIGFFNLQNNSYNILYDTYALQFNPHVIAVDHGQFLWSPENNPTQLNDIDMATANRSLITPPNVTFGFDVNPNIQANWPYLLYVPTDHVAHVYNMQTQQDHPLSMIAPTGATTQIALVGDSVLWTVPATGSQVGTTVEEVTHIDQPATAAQTVMVIPNATTLTQLVATPRLIAWSDGANFAAYDRQRQIFVTLHSVPQASFAVTPLAAHGNQLWYEADDNTQPAINVIDSTNLGG